MTQNTKKPSNNKPIIVWDFTFLKVDLNIKYYIPGAGRGALLTGKIREPEISFGGWDEAYFRVAFFYRKFTVFKMAQKKNNNNNYSNATSLGIALTAIISVYKVFIFNVKYDCCITVQHVFLGLLYEPLKHLSCRHGTRVSKTAAACETCCTPGKFAQWRQYSFWLAD